MVATQQSMSRRPEEPPFGASLFSGRAIVETCEVVRRALPPRRHAIAFELPNHGQLVPMAMQDVERMLCLWRELSVLVDEVPAAMNSMDRAGAESGRSAIKRIDQFHV